MRLAKARDRSDAAYATFVGEVRAACQADAYGIAKIAVDPLDPAVPAAGLMQQSCLASGVYWAHHKGSGGQEVPDEVKVARTEAIAALKELRDGGRTLDTDTDPVSNSGTSMVTMNSSRRLSRRNTGGYC